jgi:hypothetical protein
VVVALHRDRMAVPEQLAPALAALLVVTSPRAFSPGIACDNGSPAYPVRSVRVGSWAAGCRCALVGLSVREEGGMPAAPAEAGPRAVPAQPAVVVNSSVGLGFGNAPALGLASVNSALNALPWASSPW